MSSKYETSSGESNFWSEARRIVINAGILYAGYYVLTGPYGLATKGVAAAASLYGINNLAR